MSKKISFPVMSLMITGVLYVVGIFLLTLKRFASAVLTAPASAVMDGLLGFLAAFLLIWAFASLCLHPDIDDKNVKIVLILFTVFFAIAIFTTVFQIGIIIGQPL